MGNIWIYLIFKTKMGYFIDKFHDLHRYFIEKFDDVHFIVSYIRIESTCIYIYINVYIINIHIHDSLHYIRMGVMVYITHS